MILKRYNPQDESFLRSVVFPEEDRRLFTTAPWRGEYRWYRSPNIIPLEHWRRPAIGEDARQIGLIATLLRKRQGPRWGYFSNGNNSLADGKT